MEPFESLVVKAWTKITFTVDKLCSGTFAMNSWDGILPPGLVVIGLYTMLKRGSKTIPIILRNTTGSPISLHKGWKIAHVQACNEVPQPCLKPGVLEYLDELEGKKPTLSVVE